MSPLQKSDSVPENVRIVPRHIGHHGAHSGYDALFSQLGIPHAASPFMRRLAQALPHALAWRLWSLRPQPTARAGLVAELGAAPWLARGRGRLCHFIYGEDTYFWTPLWKSGRNLALASFHYPPERLMQRINPGSVRMLDGAVIIASNQRAALESLLPAERVYHCPHGVDADFFRPTAHPAQPVTRLVCIGSLLRDYETLRRVHVALTVGGFEFELHVVGVSDAQRQILGDLPQVHFHHGISDAELLRLYLSCQVGVLPLLDATANNGLLEMLACGLPVVVSDVGGIADYTRGSAARLIPRGDDVAMVAAIAALLQSAETRQAEGAVNRRHVETHLSNAVVAGRMREIYQDMAARARATAGSGRN